MGAMENRFCLQSLQRQRRTTGTKATFSARVHARVRNIANDPRREAKLLLRRFLLLYRLLCDSGVPWSARAVAGLSVCYVLSPIQLIPSFIPVIGQLDDLLVIWIGMALVRKCTPAPILSKHLRQLDLAGG